MTIAPIETTYAGVRFRSRTEARWAVFLTELGLSWEYEKEGYALPSGAYLPDFWLPAMSLWLEIKGDEPTEPEVEKCRELAYATGKAVLLAIGAPREADQIIPFDGEYDLFPSNGEVKRWCQWWPCRSRFCFMEDRKQAGRFWLSSLNDLGGFAIGPDWHDPNWKYPVVGPAVQAAFAAARSARFSS